MQYLDVGRLNAIDPAEFRSQKPYPWINPPYLLTEEGYACLLQTLPDVRLFTPHFRKQRKHGQYSHDRFTLEYHDDLNVAQPWKEFIKELRAKDYQRWIRQLMGARSFELLFHWHYTPKSCSVSPHCDAKRKLGSHIFYFNTAADWDPAWGGETLILDDGGRFEYKSAPKFEDFGNATASQALGNRSLLFARQDHSWHGVQEIACPEGYFRKVFIVVINRYSTFDRLKRAFGQSSEGYE